MELLPGNGNNNKYNAAGGSCMELIIIDYDSRDSVLKKFEVNRDLIDALEYVGNK